MKRKLSVFAQMVMDYFQDTRYDPPTKEESEDPIRDHQPGKKPKRRTDENKENNE